NFSDLMDNKKAIAEKEIKMIQGEIETLNNEIIRLEHKKNPKYYAEIQGKFKQKQEELKTLVEPKEIKDPNKDTLLSGINREILVRIDQLQKEREQLYSQLEEYKIKKQALITEKLGLQEVVQELKLKQQEIIYFQSN